MGSFWWWTALTLAHVLLIALLWRFRGEDHPWLLAFFGVQWLVDLVGFMIYPTKLGGLNLLAGGFDSVSGRVLIFYVSNVAWFTFWLLPAMTAERLALERTRRFWRPAIAGFSLIWLGVVYGFITGRISRQLYLGLIHFVVDPLLLFYAMYYLWRYLQRCLSRSLAVDLLTLALMLECTNLTLKLLFAVRPSLALDRSFSAMYHSVCLVTFFTYYAVVKVRQRRALSTEPQPAGAE